MNQFKQVAEQVVQKSLDVTTKVVSHISKNTTSVFGAAPSLSQMRAMNKMNKDKKVLFRGATFWYYFRVYYPYMCPAILLTFMIISLTAWNTIEGHLVMGSILSLIGGCSVIGSYIMIVPWQKHPSVLVVYRTLTNMIFSIIIILEAISRKEESCRNFATITNYILLASESWLTTIASDLVHSLTNPFASYKANLRRYHILVWSLSGLLSFIFYFDKACQGRFDNSICWVKVTSTKEPCLWGYYLFWIVCMYAYQMWAFIFAYLRLRRGLSVTFEVRKKTAQETFKCLASYAVYLSFLMLFFMIISSDPSPKPHSSMANFSLFFLFVIANRGTVDSIIWFMLHDFLRDPPASQIVDPESGVATTHQRKSVTPDLHDLSKIVHQVDIQNVKKTVTTAVTDIADLAIAEFDETDLSPQVNMALRQQIVQYVTTGVRDSILQQNIQTHKKQQGGVDSFMEKVMNPRTKDPAVVPGISVLKFYIDGEHTFKAFGIEVFKSLRMQEGISDEHYLASLSKPANERLSEGASGAFMFFCGGGEFIVKTIRAREAKVLHQSLDKYTTYLRQHKTSFLCRFVGSYSLRLYDQTFYFVVMMNCFDPHAKINERYDIKGSWVGRSADPPSSKQTKRVVCRHCNTYFVPVQQQQCTVIVGLHEPNIVLKDNDLRAKISLDPLQAAEVVEILKRDSNLLGELGVLDYSLLAGVKKYKFSVDVSDEEIGLSDKDIKDIYIKSTYKAKAVTGPAIYYLGIVDFLQDWTTKKKIERLFKIYVGRKDPDGLSVMEPIAYMERFQNKMIQIFDVDVPPSQPSEGKPSTTKEEPMQIKSLHADDVIVKKHYAYTVLADETSNPMVDEIQPQEEVKPAINTFESPPLPKRRTADIRSLGSGSNYGDDTSIISETERLRRGLNPTVAADPYQYVYDVINSPDEHATLEESAVPPTPAVAPSTSTVNSPVDTHPKNTEFNDYIEL